MPLYKENHFREKDLRNEKFPQEAHLLGTALFEDIGQLFDGSRIRERRKRKELTQKQLAKILHLTQSAICEYETGKAVPSLRTLFQLAVVLNTSTDYLLGLINDPYPVHFSNAVTGSEQDLLQAFHALSPENQERAIGFLIGLGEGQKSR